MGTNLEDAFRSYLESHFDIESAELLAEHLKSAGFDLEATLLRHYCSNGPNTEALIESEKWGIRKCWVSSIPHNDPQEGDFWFDLTELAPMVALRKPGRDLFNQGDWVSIHPVYVWQFRTFLQIMRWGIRVKDFLAVDDLFDKTRFNKMQSTDFIFNLYHEEAIAYAHWFRKSTTNHFTLQLASEHLEAQQFHQICPEGLRFWGSAEYSGSEFYREAYGQDTLFHNPYEDFVRLNETEIQSLRELSIRALYQEFERDSSVGLITTAFLTPIEPIVVPIRAYEFVELLNVAPRIPPE